MTAAACKTLHDDHVKLKSKHQQLLARLPSTQSPSASPEPLSRASSRYSVSLSRPLSEYDSSPIPPTTATYKSHARKVSVSTTEISNLADQNAELLDKLERIQSESLNADQSGRRALKRLEKEISMLRDELEKTQAKSEELEQKAKVGWDSEKIIHEILKKKEERETKFRAMRNLGQGGPEEDDDMEIRDFAPEGSGFGGPNATHSFFPQNNSQTRLPTTPLNRSIHASAPLTPHPQSILVSQLLEKIQELGETNARIIDQQAETSNQLHAMQRETEHISKVYECFADANFVEVEGDSENEERLVHDETIRFKSFRRNLAGDLPASPNGKDMYQSLGMVANHKQRKSVVGLFDAPENDVKGLPSIPDHLKSLDLPVPFGSTSFESRRTSSYTSEAGLISPALSSVSLSPSKRSSQRSISGPPRTLETELANELNGSWGLRSTRHHAHTNSLYDLTQISAPSSPSPSSHSSVLERSSLDSSHNNLPSASTAMPMKNGSSLQLTVDPPTPDRNAETKRYQGSAKDGKQSQRYHRMTETLRSRTNRWVDGRYKGSSLSGHDTDLGAEMHGRGRGDEGHGLQGDDDDVVDRPPTPLSLRLASAFDAAVENITGQQPVRSAAVVASRDVVPSEDKNKAVTAGAGPGANTAKKSKGFSAIMLEVWLWLQFAIIVLVFLWAMARRGPKSVLGEIQTTKTATQKHRRTVSMTSSRSG